MPEHLFPLVMAVMLGWGGFTWRKSEEALTQSREAADKIDQVELKMAEQYLTKQEFEKSMDRLFGVLGDMKDNIRYLTERVDYHVIEQTNESKELRRKLKGFEDY
tara:strand:+ start:1529 stop:1843 length:315 start_codon:yes stop_codon:yes gene_type:complete